MAIPIAARRRVVKEFSPSRVVTRTISVWWRTLPQLLVVAAIVHLPLLAVKWWLNGAPEGSPRAALGGCIAALEFTVFSRVIEGFAVLLVFKRLRREPGDVGRSIQTGVRRIGAILAIAAITAVAFFTFPFIGLLFGSGSKSSFGAAELALVAVIPVALIYSLVFYIPIPAALVEGLGPFAAFNRSRVLTSGCRGRIFGMWMMFGFVTGISSSLVQALLLSIQNPTAALLANAAVDWLAASLTCVLPIVLYHDLRETKEGIGIEELLKVFE